MANAYTYQVIKDTTEHAVIKLTASFDGSGQESNVARVQANTLYGALNANTTGNYNSAFGVMALSLNTTASASTAVGYQALYANTTGAASVAVGYHALYSNTTADKNVAVGTESMENNTTGI